MNRATPGGMCSAMQLSACANQLARVVTIFADRGIIIRIRTAIVASCIAANLYLKHVYLNRTIVMAVTPTTSSTAPTPRPLSAGDVRGIVREVLSELHPTSSGGPSRSAGSPGLPLLGTGGGEWYDSNGQ